MSPEVIAALLGLIGVIVGAIPTYLFMRQRNIAEIEKLKAETDKIKVEAKRIGLETDLLASDTDHAERTAQEKHLMEETLHSNISTLDNHEKAILREFVIQGRNTVQVPEEDIAVASLLQKSIIYTIGDGKQVLGVGWVYPVSLSSSAKAIIKNSGFQVIGFPPGKPSPDQVKRIQSLRPGFVLDIEHSNW